MRVAVTNTHKEQTEHKTRLAACQARRPIKAGDVQKRARTCTGDPQQETTNSKPERKDYVAEYAHLAAAR